MKNIDEILGVAKLSELIGSKKEDEESKKVLWILAIIGAVAAVAAIAVMVYKYLSPEYLEEDDDDFDDDFFEEEEEEPVDVKEKSTDEAAEDKAE